MTQEDKKFDWLGLVWTIVKATVTFIAGTVYGGGTFN